MRPLTELEHVQALIGRGLNDCEIARRTRIPRSTVRDWRHGLRKQLPPVSIGSEPTGPYGCTVAHDFSALPPAGYAYLLGVYLGDGCISACHRGVWKLRIFMDIRYPEILDACCAAMEVVMPGQHAHRLVRRGGGCVEMSMYSKHWPCLIPQHGPGRKHLRRINLAPWQEAIVEAERECFIRGLIHSDGTRIIAVERRGTYIRRAPRYAFSNLSEDIKKLFCDNCDALGIHWTRPNPKQIAIYRLESVSRLDEFVGPKR